MSGGAAAWRGDLTASVTRLRAAGCVHAEAEAEMLAEAAVDPDGLADLVRRRCTGEPVEHLVGWAQFRGIRVSVRPGVFVPRHRTGLLVDTALELLAARPVSPAPGTGPVLVDLCCGSGAVGAVLALAVGPAAPQLYAGDIDPAAVSCARETLDRLLRLGHPGGVVGAVALGDLFAALPAVLRGRVDILCANVPYVPTAALATMPGEAREHEPPQALDGGPDGLTVLRRVAAAAGEWLLPGGHVLMEVGDDQADAALRALEAGGLRGSVVTDDDGRAGCVVGTRDP